MIRQLANERSHCEQSRSRPSRFVKKHKEKKNEKKFLGLGCCDKIASENNFIERDIKYISLATFL